MQPVKLPCYCGSLRQTSRLVTQLYDQFLQPAGLTITQFGILKLLAARPGLTTGELGGALVMDSTTLSRTLKIMEGNAWISLLQGADKRKRCWSLSETGSTCLSQADPLWAAAQSQLTVMAGELNLDELSDAIYRLVQRVTS